jgi:hypothetical protein
LQPVLAPQRDLPWVMDDRALLVQTGYELRQLQPSLQSWSADGQVRHHFDWKQPFRPEQNPQGAIFLGQGEPPAGLLARYPGSRLLAHSDSGRVHLQAWLLQGQPASKAGNEESSR